MSSEVASQVVWIHGTLPSEACIFASQVTSPPKGLIGMWIHLSKTQRQSEVNAKMTTNTASKEWEWSLKLLYDTFQYFLYFLGPLTEGVYFQ